VASDELNLALVSIGAKAECRKHTSWKFFFNDFDSARMLCAGAEPTPPNDVCKGDSGGPLAVRGAAGAPVLVGVASFGGPCTRLGKPGFYARVGAGPLRKWVLDYIGPHTVKLASNGRVLAIGRMTFSLRKPPSLRRALKAFGRPASRRRRGAVCRLTWPRLGMTVYAANFGLPRGKSVCALDYGFVHTVHLAEPGDWRTDRGLRMEDPATDIAKYYKGAYDVTPQGKPVGPTTPESRGRQVVLRWLTQAPIFITLVTSVVDGRILSFDAVPMGAGE
jgi:hypothetical protein